MRDAIMFFLHMITGLLFVFTLLGFAITSLRENETRAFRLTLITSLLVAILWFGIGATLPEYVMQITVAFWILTIAAFILLMLPLGKSPPLEIDPLKTERFDERHVIFGRMDLVDGLPQYETYYTRINPQTKRFDDHLRSMPRLGQPGGNHFHPLDSPYFKAVFKYIDRFNHLADPGEPEGQPVDISPPEAARRIKGFAKHLGAADVRITRLKDYHIYSHTGRRLDDWGQALNPEHRYAVVLSIEMKHPMVHSAPLNPGVTETAARYMQIADIAIAVATYITEIGYRARAHIDGNYHVLNTALAHEAGIGELGRLGLIISPKYGPRIRLAAVTTDLSLETDSPINIGVQHFCEICKKCADNCPSGSIDTGSKKPVRGVEKWQSNMESCYQYWRKAGTDCGICLAVCPFSKPNTLYHRMVRYFNARNGIARKIFLWMDDLFYSRKPRHHHQPDWFGKD
jgi:reductive dehalogenase